jgi:protein-L-isoaspartate(D-aspartate) O-methyltransferase
VTPPRRRWLAAALLAWLAPARARGDYATQRARLVREIEAVARGTAAETGRATLRPAVLQALARVPRHRFVPESLAASAYADRPLPIGAGQTISQPFIVALMTDLIEPEPDFRVLEVGTGSGYQAAVLAEYVARVYSIEIVASLGERARALLTDLGYRNVDVRIGDGYAGWPDAAPFDAIVVTAAPEQIPQPLLDQLKPGGRMVIPVGARSATQDLLVITKAADGKAETRRVLPVRFVPLTR